MPLPSGCPCPKESYCNLGSNTCVAGCLDDDTCQTGRICDAGSRQCKNGCRMDSACAKGKICDDLSCRAGCRRDGDCGVNELCEPGSLTCKAGCTSDAACGMGQICESLRCKAGCRNDAGCAMGSICESMKCRAGCRQDMDCGADAVCKLSTLSCVSCGPDPDEAMDTMLSTSGRSVSKRVTRVLCGAGDVDRVTWKQSPPNPGYYKHSEWVTVSGASAGAMTTVELDFGVGMPKTVTVVGNGYQPIHSDGYDFYCFMGMCAGWTYRFETKSNSETPVTVELGVSVSATR